MAASTGVAVLVRVEGAELPGRDCTGLPGDPGYRNVHVGVQRRNRPGEVLELAPGDAAAVSWELDCRLTGEDLTGPYVQGRPGDRFVYLCWGEVDPAGGFAVFRRAKLMLAAVPPEVLLAAGTSGRLVGRLGLTDRCGQPLCAAVRPPVITWTAPAG